MKPRLLVCRLAASSFIASMTVAIVASVIAADPVLVVTPARPGPVTGTKQNSDEFIWRLFVQFVAPVSKGQPSPVVFETWASDKDTFSVSPHWPEPNEPKKFQASVLRSRRVENPGPIDIPCAAPGNAAVGGFPTTGSPAPCIAEEVRRNRPLFDYIVKNHLNTQEGLAAAYKAQFNVIM